MLLKFFFSKKKSKIKKKNPILTKTNFHLQYNAQSKRVRGTAGRPIHCFNKNYRNFNDTGGSRNPLKRIFYTFECAPKIAVNSVQISSPYRKHFDTESWPNFTNLLQKVRWKTKLIFSHPCKKKSTNQ